MSESMDVMEDGHICLAVGDLDGAANCYLKATELNPQSAEAWHAYGMIRYKQGQYSDAIQAGLKAVEINPNDAMVWTSLSLAYMKNQQIPEAESAAGKARIISWGGKVS